MQNFPKDSETHSREIQGGQENVGSWRQRLDREGSGPLSPESIMASAACLLDSGGREHVGAAGAGEAAGVRTRLEWVEE